MIGKRARVDEWAALEMRYTRKGIGGSNPPASVFERRLDNLFFMDSRHNQFMAEAIILSKKSLLSGGGPFGAIVVKNGEIIGIGKNNVTIGNDPTAHAEIVAIRDACKKISDFQLSGCIIYSSCEPCPMCLSAIYWAQIKEIYFANTRKDAADIGFQDDFIYEEIKKPLKKRAIPCKQVGRDSALEAFRLWMKKNDKVEY